MSYIATSLQSETFYNYSIQQVDSSHGSDESSYTWSNLIQGRYQFIVVAFTSKGPGEASILMLPSLPSKLMV